MEIENKIKEVLEQVRPSLQMDGGDVEFVQWNAETGILDVRLQGHCAHCAFSTITLKQGIESELKAQIPEVKEVRAV